MLLATHDRSTIERVGGRVLTLDGGRLGADEEVTGSAPPEIRPGEVPEEAEVSPEGEPAAAPLETSAEARLP